MDVIWNELPGESGLASRMRHTRALVDRLVASSRSPAVLEVSSREMRAHCEASGYEYSTADVVAGKLRVPATDADVIYVGFALHALGEACLPVLNQLRRHSTARFLVIGEDLHSQQHDRRWMLANAHRFPHGVFRSDREWKCLFDLFRFTLQHRYLLQRGDEGGAIRRCVYVLRLR